MGDGIEEIAMETETEEIILPAPDPALLARMADVLAETAAQIMLPA